MNRWGRLLVVVIVLGLVVYAVVRLVDSNRRSTAGPSGLDDIEVPSAGVIRWSPDATKLAVIADGEVVIVRVADAEELGRTGATVVDTAWMPDARRVVLVEGPIPTGEVVAIGLDGQIVGTTALQPSTAFAGRGLAVDERGTRAAVITTTRTAVGGVTDHDLAVVQLQTGQVRVFATDDQDETNPVFVDDTTVAYAAAGQSGPPQLHSVDIETGVVSRHGTISEGPLGVLASGEVVVGRRTGEGAYRLDAISLDGDVRSLGVLPRATRPIATDRFGTRALVRRLGEFGGTRLAIEALRN